MVTDLGAGWDASWAKAAVTKASASKVRESMWRL
jgi:hypothetical protein